MSVPFPSTLQNKVDAESFNYSFGDTTLRSQMDVGPAKVRRRFTRAVDMLTTSIMLDYDQYATFKIFYETTTNGGVTPFTYENPLTGASEEFRFAEPPSIQSIGGRTFRVGMKWEKLP